MKGFPKVLKTAQDVKNCKDMVDAGQLQAADLLEAIEAIENQNFIICPIRELSEDKKTVTVTYCNEAAAGAKVTAGGVTATIQSVEHIDGRTGRIRKGREGKDKDHTFENDRGRFRSNQDHEHTFRLRRVRNDGRRTGSNQSRPAAIRKEKNT